MCEFSKGTGKKGPKCKYLGKNFAVGSIIEEKTAQDKCTKAILRCKKVAKKGKIVLEAQNNCVCPISTGTTLDDIKALMIEQHLKITGKFY